MVAYLDYLETTIDAKTGLISDAQLGDWLGPQNNALGTAFLSTAYHAHGPRHHGARRLGPGKAG